MNVLQKMALAGFRTKLRVQGWFAPAAAARSVYRFFCTPPSRNLHIPAAVFAEAEQINTRFGDFEIRGYRWNKGGEPRVLLLHGFQSSVVNFDFYIRAFIDKGYEVLAFDAPAHGRSTGRQLNVVDYRRFILFLQEEFGQASRFFAHSMGGLSLCLALEESPPPPGYRVVLVAPLIETSNALSQVYQFLRLHNPAVHREMNAIIRKLGGHDLDWFSLNRVIRNLHGEILLLHDEDDRVTPIADLDELRTANQPNLNFVITRGLGHRQIYRDNQVRERIVSFL